MGRASRTAAPGLSAPAPSAQTYADSRDALELLQRIQTVRSALGPTRRITSLRELRLAQRLDGLYSDACAPGADRAALWRQLVSYAESVSLLPYVARGLKAKADSQRAGRASWGNDVRAKRKPRQQKRHPKWSAALALYPEAEKRFQKSRPAYLWMADELSISYDTLQKKILTPARKAGLIPSYFRAKK